MNKCRIVDDGINVEIFYNNTLKMNFSITPEFRNTGYIEIGSNYLPDPTAFDEITISSY